MAKEGRRQKIGRNDPCPCGSGKKYKKCHGLSQMQPEMTEEISAIARQKLEEREALDIQRRKQQGLGKPIISTDFKGQRLVAVGKRLHWSNKWKTFHDFLGDYIKFCFGKDWWLGEVKKDPEERHTILKWSKLVWEHLTNNPGMVKRSTQLP